MDGKGDWIGLVMFVCVLVILTGVILLNIFFPISSYKKNTKKTDWKDILIDFEWFLPGPDQFADKKASWDRLFILLGIVAPAVFCLQIMNNPIWWGILVGVYLFTTYLVHIRRSKPKGWKLLRFPILFSFGFEMITFGLLFIGLFD